MIFFFFLPLSVERSNVRHTDSAVALPQRLVSVQRKSGIELGLFPSLCLVPNAALSSVG